MLRNHMLTVVGCTTAACAFAWSGTVATAAAPFARLHTTVLQDDVTVLRDYLSGNGMLNRGLNELAAEEYRKFLTEHPEHEKAPLARYGLGVALFRMRQYADAANALEPLVEINDFPFAAETDLLLGQAHLQLGAFDDAATALHRMVQDHPDHTSADDAAALLVESMYRQGAHDELDQIVDSVLERWPQNPQRERIELFDGLAKLARRQYEPAANRFEGMLERFPGGAFADRATLLLGRAAQHLGDDNRAVAQYQRVLQQENPAYLPEALYGLGVILRAQGETKRAGQYLDELLESYSDSSFVAAARFERGRAFLDEEAFDSAYPHFEAIATLDHDLADDAAYWAAKTRMRQSRPGEAARALGEAIARFPDSPLQASMQYDMAIALLRDEQPEEAIGAFRAFRRTYSDHAMAGEALYLMATTAHSLADYDRSAQYAEEFLDRYPTSERAPAVAYLHAENAFLAGDMEAAAERFQGFLKAHPDHEQSTNATFRLGTAHYRLNEYDDALPYLTRVVNGRDTPEAYRSALFAIGDIAFAQSRWLDAERVLLDYVDTAADAVHVDDALIRLGIAQHRQEKYDSALASYARLLADHPESAHRAQAMFEKGQALVGLERPDEATTAFETLLETQANERFVGHALNHLGALAMQQERYADAAAWYEQVAASDLDAATRGEALFQRGQALLAVEQYGAAHAAFTRLQTEYGEHPRAPLAAANAAIALARQSKPQETIDAIGTIDAALLDQLSPSMRSTLLYERAWAHRDLEQPDEAAAIYRAMLTDSADDPLDAFARIELAELESAARRFDAAAELLRETPLNDLPDALRPRATYRLGVCEYELGHFEEAADALGSFLDESPDHEHADSAALLCGESLFRINQYEGAATYLKRVVNDDTPESYRSPALLRLGECQSQLQEFAASEQTFRTHREQFGDSPVWFQAQFGIAWALENQGEYDTAIAAYRTVVDQHQGATAARAQFQIGECLFAQKQYEQAVRELLKVDILYAYPEWSAAALYEAGRCFESMAQTGQARQQYEQVRERYPQSRWAELSEQRLAALARTDLPGRGGG